MANEIRIEGLEEVLARLEKVGDTKVIKKTLADACLIVERTAKQKAVAIRDTGALSRSIKSEVREDATEIIGVIYTPLEYAPYVEYGTGLFAEDGGRKDVPWKYKDDKGNWHTTSGQHPQPFMRPALNENKEAIKRIIAEGVTKNND